jgi:hypothetical protein
LELSEATSEEGVKARGLCCSATDVWLILQGSFLRSFVARADFESEGQKNQPVEMEFCLISSLRVEEQIAFSL